VLPTETGRVSAGNLANFLRQLVLPKPIKGWALTTLREKLIKIGAKVVSHSKYVIFQLAEVAVPRQLFAAKRAGCRGFRNLRKAVGRPSREEHR
jgi:hypothetical protein